MKNGIARNKVTLKVEFSPELFDKCDLNNKAEYIMALKQAENDIKNALAEVQKIFEEDFNDSRNDVTETVQLTTEFGTIELPSGFKEKTLKLSDVETFAVALRVLDKEAYAKVVSMAPKLDKVEINRLRKEIGPMKDLIDNTYKTTEPKPCVYQLNKTI